MERIIDAGGKKPNHRQQQDGPGPVYSSVGETADKAKPERKSRRVSVLRIIVLLISYGGSAAAGGAYFAIRYADRFNPQDLREALTDRPAEASLVYARDGRLIGEFTRYKRKWVPLTQIPQLLQQAIISAEDKRFWNHRGFDPVGMARAAYANYKGGGVRQGGSTITQQTVKRLFLSLHGRAERTPRRKLRELALALRVERELTKRDILEIYLNHIYLGNGAWGVQAAAEKYFAKDVRGLSVAEAAMLAGLVQKPNVDAPHRNYNNAKARQRYVLRRMVKNGYITEAQRKTAVAQPLIIVAPLRKFNHVVAPYFVTHVRRWAEKTFGSDAVFEGGLRIHTTLDLHAQNIAEKAMRTQLEAVDRTLGFRGPIRILKPAQYKSYRILRAYTAKPSAKPLETGDVVLPEISYEGVVTRMTRRQITIDLGPKELPLVTRDATILRTWRDDDGSPLGLGSVIPVRVAKRGASRTQAVELAQVPAVQGGLFAVEQHTGRVVAMVGGYDWRYAQLNHATQTKRQIGSAMKPFLYAAAIERGASQIDKYWDGPAASGWPKNYGDKYANGLVTMRTALAKSYNTVAVRLLEQTGIGAVVDMLERLGLRVPQHHQNLSLALGTPEFRLSDVVAAHATMANGGKFVAPRFVELVTTADGRVLADYRNDRPKQQVVPAGLAHTVVDLMQAPAERGTARKAQVLGRPIAGKTGTSGAHRDAWFVGYTADLIAGVWIGRKENVPISDRASGGGTALPVWINFMKHAHPKTPARGFPPPTDVVFGRVNEFSGQPARPRSYGSRLTPFPRGRVPARLLKNYPANFEPRKKR